MHFFSKKATPIKTIQKKDWVLIVLLGLTQSSLMQFSQYIALQSVDPTTLNLLSNLSTILIIVMSVWILKESPTWLQLVGTGVFVLGVLAYYYPFGEEISNWWGYAMGGLFIIGGAFASILSRAMGRRGTVNSITYTAISMLVGGEREFDFGVVCGWCADCSSTSVGVGGVYGGGECGFGVCVVELDVYSFAIF